MTETLWAALIAVIGTTAGASIAPVASALSASATNRQNAKSARIEAAALFAEKINLLGRRAPERFDFSSVNLAYQDAVASRFELAKHLARGEGNVDRFVEYAIGFVSKEHDDLARLTAAEYAASQVLRWARGDLNGKDLRSDFELVRNGQEFEVL